MTKAERLSKNEQLVDQRSSDNQGPILYHVISFIQFQWDPAEINRWVTIRPRPHEDDCERKR